MRKRAAQNPQRDSRRISNIPDARARNAPAALGRVSAFGGYQRHCTGYAGDVEDAPDLGRDDDDDIERIAARLNELAPVPHQLRDEAGINELRFRTVDDHLVHCLRIGKRRHDHVVPVDIEISAQCYSSDAFAGRQILQPKPLRA